MKHSRSGLYVHIPFCSKRCSYCDFFSRETSDKELIEEYGKKVISVVKERLGELSSDFSTVYIGGGSPSMLPESFFVQFRNEVLSLSQFKNVEEFTVEINPADIDENWLKALAENGVNRVSIGVQAFSDRVLSEMGRRTKVSDLKKNLPIISKLFNNISVDLIYGLGENRDLKNEINSILELADTDHFSAYEYTRPEIKNVPSLIDEEEMLKQEKDLRETLIEKGFDRYEISNYSKNGKRSLHNMIYWSYGSWLGIGSGAHSFNASTGEHSFYQPDIAEFINGGGLSRFIPSKDELIEEFLLMGLRTVDGVNKAKFQSVFDVQFEDVFSSEKLRLLENESLIYRSEKNVKCTEKGFEFLNTVLLKLFESDQ